MSDSAGRSLPSTEDVAMSGDCHCASAALERIADALERLAPERGPFVLEPTTYEKR